ncbi:MAG: hypothetical protein JNL82_11820 [Myxococcales bacterium]|nr:hypothetical protein [Myxococcales bacterium]
MPDLNCGTRFVALVGWLMAACGGDEVTTIGTSAPGTTTSVDTSAGPSTEAPTGGEPSTGDGGSASASAPGTMSATATATTPTSDPDTTAGPTTDPPLTTGTETSDTGASESSGESGSGGDTGADIIPCETAADCVLIDDCCSCEPIGPGEAPSKCDLPECFVTQCGPKGLEGAALACRFGRCTFEKIRCNPTLVSCDEAPPQCGPGDLPSVDEDGTCWTGQCAPAEACDWVPDCSFCDEDELICVNKLQKGSFTVCDAKPLDCGDVEDIDCGCGQQVCDASPPHTICQETPDDIACECPVC